MPHPARPRLPARLGRITALVALLAGCAAQTPAPQAHVPEGPSGNGLLIVDLPFDMDPKKVILQTREAGKQLSFSPERVANEGIPLPYSAVWLPPGEYELTQWDGITLRHYPSIHMEAGRITDMGALLKIPVGGYAFKVLPVAAAPGRAVSVSTLPSLSKQLVNPEPLPWRMTTVPDAVTPPATNTGLGLVADLMVVYEQHVNRPSNRLQLLAASTPAELLKQARLTSSPLTQDAVVAPNGDLLYGAALGSIRVRHADGSWDTLNTGTLAGIRSVGVNGGNMLAGTETGSVLQSRDGGTSWTEVAALGGNRLVADMDYVQGKWYVVTLESNLWHTPLPALTHVTVYRSEGDTPGKLDVIKDIVMPKNPAVYWQHIRGQANGAYYYLGALTGIHRLDLASGVWNEVKTPSGTNGFYTAPEASVLTAFNAMGAFSKLFVSADGGATWQTRKTPSYPIDDIYFSAENTGVATRIDMHAFSANMELQHFDGKGWVTDATAPLGCNRILRDARHQPAFCVTTAGSILRAEKGGWQMEFAAD